MVFHNHSYPVLRSTLRITKKERVRIFYIRRIPTYHPGIRDLEKVTGRGEIRGIGSALIRMVFLQTRQHSL